MVISVYWFSGGSATSLSFSGAYQLGGRFAKASAGVPGTGERLLARLNGLSPVPGTLAPQSIYTPLSLGCIFVEGCPLTVELKPCPNSEMDFSLHFALNTFLTPSLDFSDIQLLNSGKIDQNSVDQSVMNGDGVTFWSWG